MFRTNFGMVSLVLVIGFTVSQGQNAPVRQGRVDWSTTLAKLPPDPNDAQERAVREGRSSVFNDQSADARKLDNTIDDVTTVHGMSVYHLKQPALPISNSDAIVVGNVVSFQPFLSADKTNIYTELHVRSENILKDTSSTLVVGEEFIVPRLGGTILLPSSKVVSKIVPKDERVLDVGGRYVLFLSYDSKHQWFSLVKAWGLESGQVRALAPTDVKDVLQGISKFQGMNESEFITAVQESVNNASPASGRPQ